MKCKECKHINRHTRIFCDKCGTNLYGYVSIGLIKGHTINGRLEAKMQEFAVDEKAKDLRTSEKARRYEAARKAHWAKQKPAWVKRGRNLKELSQMEK